MSGFRYLTVFSIILLNCLLVCSSAQARLSCIELLNSGQSNDINSWPSNTVMSIYRFFDGADKTKAQIASYQIHEGKLTPFHAGTLSVQGSKVSENFLIERLQNFSSQIMYENGVISKAVRDRQAELLDPVIPSQLTFVEFTHSVPKDFATNNPKLFPEHRISDLPEAIRPGETFIRDAGMWLHSGQFTFRELAEAHNHPYAYGDRIPWKSELPVEDPSLPNNHNGLNIINAAITAMPWQRNVEIMANGNMSVNLRGRVLELDRNRFPIAFEIGRAGQIPPGRFNEMMSVLSSIMVQETTSMMKSTVNQAYVFANVNNPKMGERFAKQGFKKLEGACIRPSLCVMYIPLSKFIKLYPSGKNSYYANRVQEVLGNDMADAYNMIHINQGLYRSDLDFLMPEYGILQERPIVIQDVSQLNRSFMYSLLKKYGHKNLDKVDELYREMQTWQSDLRTQEPDIYFDVPDFGPFKESFREHNLIRITNLDPEYVKHPKYLPLLLTSLDNYFVRRFKDLEFSDQGHEILNDLGVAYGIQTKNPETAAYLLYHFQKNQNAHIQKGADGKNVYTFLVHRQDVIDYKHHINNFPQDNTSTHVELGYWFFRGLHQIPWKY